MFTQIGQLIGHVLAQECRVLLNIEVFLIATAVLDPLWQLLDVARQPLRWVADLGILRRHGQLGLRFHFTTGARDLIAIVVRSQLFHR